MKTAEITDPVFLGEHHTGRRSWLFMGLTIMLMILAILGFSPKYYWPLLTGRPLLPLLQHWGIAFTRSSIWRGWPSSCCRGTRAWRQITDQLENRPHAPVPSTISVMDDSVRSDRSAATGDGASRRSDVDPAASSRPRRRHEA